MKGNWLIGTSFVLVWGLGAIVSRAAVLENSFASWQSSVSPSVLSMNSTGQLEWNSYGSSSIVGVSFAPQTLAAGESLTVRFRMTAGTILPTSSAFRVALLNSGGIKAFTGGEGLSNDDYRPFSGYGVFSDLGATSGAPATETQFVTRAAGDATVSSSVNLFGSGYPLPFGAKSYGSNLTSGQEYEGTFRITNNGSTVTLSYTLGSADLTVTTTSQAVYTTFDTLIFLSNYHHVSSVTFSSVTVDHQAVPEPSSASRLMLAGWALSCRALYRRKAR